jgi:hypothetical protein
MNTFVTLVLAAFAISSLLTEYQGPRNYFALLRDKYPQSPLQCLVCTSVYITVLLYVVNSFGVSFHLLPLATIGVIILIERIKWN